MGMRSFQKLRKPTTPHANLVCGERAQRTEIKKVIRIPLTGCSLTFFVGISKEHMVAYMVIIQDTAKISLSF